MRVNMLNDWELGRWGFGKGRLRRKEEFWGLGGVEGNAVCFE